MAEEKNFNALLERICKDGVDKANKERDEIISSAMKEADSIVLEAKSKAEKIIQEAERKARDLESNTKLEIARGGEQAISVIKQRIKKLISASVLNENLKDVFADTNFLKDLIFEIVKKWNVNSSISDISIYFSETKKNEINSAFENSIRSAIKNVIINFDKRISNGFKIVPEGKNYQLQFTDEDFIEFFSNYINNTIEEIIFNKVK